MTISQIRCIVERRAKKEDFEHHILSVRKHALILAKKYDANKEVIELAAYLHDISRLKSSTENHHIKGAAEAEEILKKFNYPQKTINHVKECILSHSSGKKVKPISIEAKIIASADVMSHFDEVLFLFFVAMRYKNKSLEDSRKWVYEKIRRDWKKPLLPEARKMIKEKYHSIIKVME